MIEQTSNGTFGPAARARERSAIARTHYLLQAGLFLIVLGGNGCADSESPAAVRKETQGESVREQLLPKDAVPKKAVSGESAPKATATKESNSAEVATAPESNALGSVSRFHFVDRARPLGVEFAYRNGEETGQFAILENLGGGAAVFDYDGDGWPDLLFTGGGVLGKDQSIGGLAAGFFRSHFGHFSPVRESARWSPDQHYSHGLTICDFNNDGFDDVLVTGYGGVSELLNMGDGTFAKVSDPALETVEGMVTSAAAGDFNLDGIPDLYVVTYIDWSFDNHLYCPAASGDRRELCSPKEFAGTPDYLFYGNGDGTFRAVDCGTSGFAGKGLGVLAVDVDHDFDTDIYVANDTTDNFLFLNDGQGEFAEVGLQSGVALDERALPNGSMGLSACDVNDDQRVDLWVANYERESFALYRNEGYGTFLHTSWRYGISALGGTYVGFGTDWEDFDNDGVEEIVVTNGHVLKYPTGIPRRQQPILLAKHGSRFVTESFPQDNYFAGSYEGRGLATGDLNRDGRADIVISHINENVALLINETQPSGTSLRVRLVGTRSARNAIGAHLILETSAGKQLRSVVGGGSYLSQNEQVATFGIPVGAKLKSLTVLWPSGVEEIIPGSALMQAELTLIEPDESVGRGVH